MEIKDFLDDKRKCCLDEILDKYLSWGSFFDFKEINWTYLEFKKACDDYSSDEEGYSEIFSFDLNLFDGTILEVKLYYKEKSYLGDTLSIHNNQLNLLEFETILNNKAIKYNIYPSKKLDDEGALILENQIISRYKIENTDKIIYQIECDFSLYPDFSLAREKSIKESSEIYED